ncbi:unnamed protein product, partial [Acanthoscelides obtectus]
NDTVKPRIDNIAADIRSQIINKVKLSPFFAISCDEYTDIVNCAQLIVYVRYIGEDIIQEVILYSQFLTDIFNSISNFVEKNDLDWKKLIGLCTDGAPVMIGVRSGLAKKLKEKNSAMNSYRKMHSKIRFRDEEGGRGRAGRKEGDSGRPEASYIEPLLL